MGLPKPDLSLCGKACQLWGVTRGHGAQHRTPVHLAAAHAGSAAGAALRDLLAAGGALECLDADGATPLLVALRGNRRDAIDILVAAGADLRGILPRCERFAG